MKTETLVTRGDVILLYCDELWMIQSRGRVYIYINIEYENFDKSTEVN